MKTILLTTFLLLSFSLLAQDNKLSWSKPELDSAKTADTCQFLNAIEKDAIMYLNLARLFPQKFAKIELSGYYGTKKYGDYLKDSPYIISLQQMLDTIQPMSRLIPVDSMAENAKCFAIEMGDSGYTGHERIKCAKEKKYAECCSFGMNTGKDIMMQMLIDHNIESLGHRKNCLNVTYTKIGLALHTHTEWGHCCVIELMK